MKRAPHFYSRPLSPLPRVGTAAALDFFASWRQINSLLNFLLRLVASAHPTSEKAYEVLIETEEDPGKRREMAKRCKERKTALDVLREHRQLLTEIILVRHIENYLNYLAALLFEIFTQRPKTLRSSEKVELSELLKHKTMDDVVRDVAERKVAALSYSSLRDLADYFSERFGLEIATSAQLSAACKAVEIRNISVHNRCIINRRFVSQTGCESSSLGQKKELPLEYLNELVPTLAELVKKLDKNARNKMNLKAVRFKQRK